MPIAKYQSREATFPKLGTLRKGAPKPERGPGRDLNYFRFDPIDEQTGKEFAEIYGDEPRSINVFLPYATTEENFQCWQEEYTASELKHRCDGEYVYERDTKTGTLIKTDKPCPGGCQEVARLTVIIPELKRFAYVTVLTGSTHDIVELLGNLQAIEALQRGLQGIPMVLRRVKRMISTPMQDGKKRRVEKWLLNIEVAPQWARSMLTSMERQAMPLLETKINDRPTLVDTRSGEIIEAEHTIEDAPSTKHAGAFFDPNTPQPNGRVKVSRSGMERRIKELFKQANGLILDNPEQWYDAVIEDMTDDEVLDFGKAFAAAVKAAQAEQSAETIEA